MLAAEREGAQVSACETTEGCVALDMAFDEAGQPLSDHAPVLVNLMLRV